MYMRLFFAWITFSCETMFVEIPLQQPDGWSRCSASSESP
jgi:hypothetical protein